MHRQKNPKQKLFWANKDVTREIFKYYFTQSCPIKLTVSLLAPITVKIMLVTSSNLPKADSCSRKSYSPNSCLSGSY